MIVPILVALIPRPLSVFFFFFYSLLMVIEKILPLTNGGTQVAPLDVS